MLLTDKYREQQRKLHENEHYGTSSPMYAGIISNILNQTGISNMLDYGCGKGMLAKSIEVDHPVDIYQYDPAIEGIDYAPDPASLVVCTDVLEHIEPELIDNVLDDLERVTNKIGFFSIHTGPALKVLDDGRNAHLIQEPPEWWLPKIMSRFVLTTFQAEPKGFFVVVRSKKWH